MIFESLMPLRGNPFKSLQPRRPVLGPDCLGDCSPMQDFVDSQLDHRAFVIYRVIGGECKCVYC